MKELVKSIDCLSPTITLYYSNSLKHQSFLSGILTIIHYTICLAITCYYLIIVISHTCSTSFYYKVYLDDPGIFEVSNESLFHYLTFKNGFEFDPRAMSVIGLEKRPSFIVENNNEIELDHWIYKNCTIDFHPKNSKDLTLDKYGLCLSEFFDSETQQIFTKEQEGFKYPTIQHGTGNDNSIPYAVVVQACQNKTKGGACYSPEKINEYFHGLFSIVMHIQDKYVDVNNFSNPFVTFMNTFEVGIMHETIISSNMHFSPTIVFSHEGYVFESKKKNVGYSYDQVVRGSYDQKKENIVLSMFHFWMHNQADFYERQYYKFQDVIANISGLMKLSSAIFFVINLAYHQFVLFDDFNGILFDIQTKSRASLDKLQRSQKESIESRIKIIGSKPKPKLSTKIANQVPSVKKVDLGFVPKIKHLLRCGRNSYIERILSLRQKLVSEEKLIKNFISFHRLVNIHKSSGLLDKFNQDEIFMNSIIYDDLCEKNNKEFSSSIEYLTSQNVKSKSLKMG